MNEAFLMEIFWWIKPKSQSAIWAQSIKKAMLDIRLLGVICPCPVKIGMEKNLKEVK